MTVAAFRRSWGGVHLMRRLPSDRLYAVITGMLLAVGTVLLVRSAKA